MDAADGQRWWFDSGSLSLDFAYTGALETPGVELLAEPGDLSGWLVARFPEVAATGAGRLVQPEDPAALASALAELLEDASARERLAAAAKDAAAGPYSWRAIATQTPTLYAELTK